MTPTLTLPEVPMPKTMTPRRSAPPRLPRLDAAERLVRKLWLSPTEEGLRDARRTLVRAMWRARRAGATKLRTQLRALYRQVCAAQAARDWEVTPQERASRRRNVQQPEQYQREQLQQLPGHSALITLSQPGERWRKPVPQPRPLGRTRTRIVHDELSGKNRRERERRAREYAERYYQALRHWDVRQTESYELPRVKGGGSDGRMVPVVGNWASVPLEVRSREVTLPWRNASETLLAQLCSQDETLSCIRDGQRRMLATLVDPRGGWHPNKAKAVEYAQAVLTLAFHLGDPKAEEHLRNIPVAEIQ